METAAQGAMARLAVLANKDNLCTEDEALAKVYVGRIDEALGDQNTIGVQDSKIVELAGAANGLITALASLGSAGIAGVVVGVSVGVLALANNLFSAKAQAKRLNKELANMTGENNKIRKEDFQ